jgi:hypothetical protein
VCIHEWEILLYGSTGNVLKLIAIGIGYKLIAMLHDYLHITFHTGILFFLSIVTV